ncbi:acyltransferase family protein [Mycolicibacterium aichiense]|uniref:Acyltransferase n=1 Tax=Mycolicibacterium aichiense TaxID=1799 RepID=A0AAD1ME22_9MYCO|nr:acyltransferase [Mycolicibacterium aichiense]MCV7019264.1 acyltransferase [Mycolicibacterium aichiense]BBX09180.1 acyltransferase [Mycolicibacterium aichiense]SUA13751.1 putative acyltransferase [Mycolicibacterium aichiense]
MSADREVAGDSDNNDDGRCRRRKLTLGEEFDPRSNALNAWRLILATGVILYHSWPLTGRHVSVAPVQQLLGNGWVDGFFAISGFLITWSWFRHSRARDYFIARGLRILPGLWVCLVVTAFVIAPIAIEIQGGSAAKLLLSPGPFKYVLGNSAVQLLQHDIDGTPSGIPWSGEWNGSLWTLFWEALCYVAIAGLGIVGLLRRRWLIPILLALALYWSATLPPYGALIDAPPGAHVQLDAAAQQLVLSGMAARFGVMFLSGALIYQLRNVIPARWSLVALSVAIVVGSSFLPNYRVLAAIPLAYAIIVSGALVHNKRLTLRTDLSYGVYIYAFPVQQLLVLSGLAFLNPFAFAIVAAVATVPLAALSWFMVEKPAVALRSRLKPKGPPEFRSREDASLQTIESDSFEVPPDASKQG